MSTDVPLLPDPHEQRLQQELRESEERFRKAFDESPLGMAITGLDYRFARVNERLCELLDFTAEELSNCTFADITHPDDIDADVDLARRLVAGEIPRYFLEKRYVKKGGDLVWINLFVSIVRDSNSEPLYFLAMIQDISERKAYEHRLQEANERLHEVNTQLRYQIAINHDQTVELARQNRALEEANAKLHETNAKLEEANKKLEALAATDRLTGLKNHGAFQDTLAAFHRHARRYDTPLSLLMLDVDRFKSYNDTFGHPAGDAVLKQVAQILQKLARGTDIVARYGGEEFGILLPMTGSEGAIKAAERLRVAIQSQEWQQGGITASIGVATLRAEITTPQSLLAEADRALYMSKRAGRNRVTHAQVLLPHLPGPEDFGN